MFQKKTTIVIGAGASKEVDLPTGKDLKNIVTRILDIRFDHYEQISGSHEICNALRVIANDSDSTKDLNEYIHSAWSIRDGMSQAISIDNYIDAHQENKSIEACGKLAIAASILDAERNSKLYIDDSNIYNKINFSAIENTWFNSFMQLLTENCRTHHLEQRLSSITLIIFNYDRCVEHFIYHALQNYYKISKDLARELVSKIDIFHPYGSLGELPWMNNQGIEFGANTHHTNLLSIIKKINTFTESTDPKSSQIVKIRQAVAKSQILLFIGFAYHKQNLKLIRPGKDELEFMTRSVCFGTSVGISKSDTKKIILELAEFGNLNTEDIYMNDMSCSKLFYEHWRSLSWD